LGRGRSGERTHRALAHGGGGERIVDDAAHQRLGGAAAEGEEGLRGDADGVRGERIGGIGVIEEEELLHRRRRDLRVELAQRGQQRAEVLRARRGIAEVLDQVRHRAAELHPGRRLGERTHRGWRDAAQEGRTDLERAQHVLASLGALAHLLTGGATDRLGRGGVGADLHQPLRGGCVLGAREVRDRERTTAGEAIVAETRSGVELLGEW
jgi:hypothetical protein